MTDEIKELQPTSYSVEALSEAMGIELRTLETNSAWENIEVEKREKDGELRITFQAKGFENGASNQTLMLVMNHQGRITEITDTRALLGHEERSRRGFSCEDISLKGGHIVISETIAINDDETIIRKRAKIVYPPFTNSSRGRTITPIEVMAMILNAKESRPYGFELDLTRSLFAAQG